MGEHPYAEEGDALANDNIQYLEKTPLLDYDDVSLRQLIADRGWSSLPVEQRIGAIYTFMRDEIGFG